MDHTDTSGNEAKHVRSLNTGQSRGTEKPLDGRQARQARKELDAFALEPWVVMFLQEKLNEYLPT